MGYLLRENIREFAFADLQEEPLLMAIAADAISTETDVIRLSSWSSLLGCHWLCTGVNRQTNCNDQTCLGISDSLPGG